MKSFVHKISKPLIVILLTIGPWSVAHGQVKLNADTLQCHIVSFSAGFIIPGASHNSQGLTGGSMRDLYGYPYLDFALEWSYKQQSGWLMGLDADIWIGMNGDNLSNRVERMGNVFNPGETSMAVNGEDGVVTAYNRALALRPGVGRIIRLLPKNPNSGLLLKVSAGWFTQKTIFHQDFNHPQVYQLSGDYAKLYDHLRNGVMLTESVGFLFMSNYSTYANFKVTFDISQCWSWSARPWQIDNLMGLNGKDQSRYFDLTYSIRLTWMFPFTGKTTYDYYYY
ncbi:MAG: hypothetical protein IJ524_03150 [Bacteroidales bacterium]|nr:hypothetical protein [Bacteroidales bacterium]